ncbi:ricin-type beta-trefoil lectin domain protein [Actinocrispum sp. NPDC049592]|uniref:RICIN domain-containing protein n=1 Tax=Actinocrispum sp. NPDC049592 TaxID=3154835 RepID=UPI00343F5816
MHVHWRRLAGRLAAIGLAVVALVAASSAGASAAPAASFRIQNQYNSHCLVNYARGGPLYVGNCQDDAYRYWNLISTNQTSTYLIQNARNGSCLSYNGSSLVSAACDGLDGNQYWHLGPLAGGTPIWWGVTNRCLSVTGPRGVYVHNPCNGTSKYDIWKSPPG